MGLDIKYQAIPDDCELLELTRKYQDDEWLFRFDSIPPPFIIEKYGKNELDFLAARKKLCANHPGIEKRRFITRAWGFLSYLLSESRRKQSKRDDIWNRIVLGGDLLIAEGKVRFLAATEVKELSILLEQTTLERQYFNVNAMIEAKVYKSNQLAQTEQTFQFILAEYNELKNMYKLAAEHNEGIITKMF
jgi:hypothetical protein